MELYTLKRKHNSLPNQVTAVKVLASCEEEARRLARNADGSQVWLTDHVTLEARPVPGPVAIVGFNFVSEEVDVCPWLPSVVEVTRRVW